MKTFIAFSALLAVATASHLYLAPAPLIVPAAVSSQYHSQDSIGQYAYGYNDNLSSKQEIKSLDGITRGSYSYIDSKNVLQTVDYTADAGGFRVAATNLPKAVEAPIVLPQDLPKQVEDTFEVAAAKSAHFAAIEEAKKQSGILAPEVVIPAPIELPRPVEDTPEVAKAKAEHLIAIEQAKLRSSYQKIDEKSEISLVQSAPLPSWVASPIPLTAYSSLPFPGEFTYSSSLVNSPVAQFVRYL